MCRLRNISLHSPVIPFCKCIQYHHWKQEISDRSLPYHELLIGYSVICTQHHH
nr:MAG TPA: hypothetical protein [Caudoviricetes sp.]